MALLQTNTLWLQQLDGNVAAIVLDPPGAVNWLDAAVLADLDKALTAIDNEPRFQVALLRSNKGASFCQGTDPSFWAGLAAPEAFAEYAERGERLCARLAGLRIPTVAVISGACLGSGLEIALACDWRVAVARGDTLLGFGDLEIGLIPSFGGIGRLHDLAGLDRLLPMLLGGRKLNPQEALACGLVDEVAQGAADEPPALLRQARKRPAGARPRRSWRQWFAESSGWSRRLLLRGAERVLRQRLPDDMPAPWEALGVLRAHLKQGQAAGLAEARAALARLSSSSAFRNLAWLHQSREKGRAASDAGPRQLAVLGSTVLALQLVLQTVARDRTVVLRERDEMALGVAVMQLVRILQEDVNRGLLSSSDYTKQVNAIRATVSWKNFEGVDVVIDASAPDPFPRSRLFQELEANTAPETLLVATAFEPSLAPLQSALQRPERVAGLSFPPPAGRAAVVEVVATEATAAGATQALCGFVNLYGKTPLVVADVPGRALQRVWAPAWQEAVILLEEGVRPERIDQALLRFGMAQGPLEQIDQLGLDEFVRLAERLHPVWPNQVPDNELVRKMFERQWLGTKMGIGFFRYRKGKKGPNRGLGLLRGRARSTAAALSSADQLAMIRARLVGLMVNETYRCLEDKVTTDAEALNLALALSGWAPHRGGPLRYLEQSGRGELVRALDELATQHGERFAPCPALRAGVD